MFGFTKKSKKNELDKKILFRNKISLLILDERWNSIFKNTHKTPEIIKAEEDLKDLLKSQSRLNSESIEIALKKKECMEMILKLTTEAFENNNEEAKKEMLTYEKKIMEINERIPNIQVEIENIPDKMNDINLSLLNYAVNEIYFKMRESKRQVDALDSLITETREKLKKFIDEKESIAEVDTEVYSYFHDLLGGEELEKLDKQYFGN